jgi:hypothetical protein
VSYRTCEACGGGFHQFGRGRPAKRCPDCRAGDRYGVQHRRIRAATVDQAVGSNCCRCHQTILPGQAAQLDHADDGSGEYLGYSHQSCNARAGAVASNKARAAAYRAFKAGVEIPISRNGSGEVGTSPEPADPPDGTVRELDGGRIERWSATYRQWVRASRRW